MTLLPRRSWSENPGIKVVRDIEVKVPGQVEDAYAQVTNALQSDKNIDAIWIGWDELAPPVVRAIEEAGLKDKIFVVGFDGNPFAWDLIRKGSPYIMEPANPFPPMGEKAVSTIETIVGGGDLASHVIYMKPCLVNEQTVPAQGESPKLGRLRLLPRRDRELSPGRRVIHENQPAGAGGCLPPRAGPAGPPGREGLPRSTRTRPHGLRPGSR